MARSLVAIPDGVSDSEAAATWAAYGTAWGGLVAVGTLEAGQTVLVSAASSGVGLAAIKIANRIGARAIALTRGRGAELTFDPVGGPEFATLAKATAAGGRLVPYGALDACPTVVPPFEVFWRDLTIRGLALIALTRDDTRLAALKRFVSADLADGTFRPTIARTFSLERIADAHRFIETDEQIGKVVVTV